MLYFFLSAAGKYLYVFEPVLYEEEEEQEEEEEEEEYSKVIHMSPLRSDLRMRIPNGRGWLWIMIVIAVCIIFYLIIH